MSPLPPLKWSDPLAKSARDHAVDSSKNSLIGHIGSDGSKVYDRISRYIKNAGEMSENIAWGIKDPRKVILAFLMDINVNPRGHRDTILYPNYKFAGVSVKPFGKAGAITVINYSS